MLVVVNVTRNGRVEARHFRRRSTVWNALAFGCQFFAEFHVVTTVVDVFLKQFPSLGKRLASVFSYRSSRSRYGGPGFGDGGVWRI